MIVLSRNRYFLSCHEIICFFKPYSIGFSPWCHGYDYEYYTTTTQLQQVPSSWLECSIYQNYTAPEVLVQVTPTQSNRCIKGCLLQGLAGVVNQGDVELMARLKNT